MIPTLYKYPSTRSPTSSSHLKTFSSSIKFLISRLHTLISLASSMKRQLENQNTAESLDLAISLMFLSQVQPPQPQPQPQHKSMPQEFECKTCNRKFSSFQALGGHRASHKKPKLDSQQAELQKPQNSQKSLHECPICGQRFSLGQALGGHMRKHRAAMNDGAPSINEAVPDVSVLKRSNSNKRVMCMDLNLTPLENDLKLLFGNKAPSINLSLC